MTGSICYATVQGLGIMAKQFYDHGIIDRMLIVPHSHHQNHFQWYREQLFYPRDLEQFLKPLDTLFLFETPFDWRIIPKARKMGIKVILQPNECTPYPFPYEPDVIHCPSLLERDKYNGVFLTVPVNATWRLRTRAMTFVHNAGNGGLQGRNGTRELIEAWKHVKSPAKLIIRTQSEKYTSDDPRIRIYHGTVKKDELFSIGDVFIFPDKFAGLSLPLQEAYASGMMVMTTDRFPLNEWLPNEPLIPVKGYEKKRIIQVVDSAIVSPLDIAQVVDYWYNRPIEEFSYRGKKWAIDNSWKKLKLSYLRLCRKPSPSPELSIPSTSDISTS